MLKIRYLSLSRVRYTHQPRAFLSAEWAWCTPGMGAN